MLKEIIEAPFNFVGWLVKDTYGRVVSIAALTLLAALVNYPIQDTPVGQWEVEDVLEERYSAGRSESEDAGQDVLAEVDKAGRIDRTAIKERTWITRHGDLYNVWAYITMPFHHVAEHEDEVVWEGWDEERKHWIKRRRITRISRGLTLGLDLRGGTELEYKVDAPVGTAAEAFRAQDIAEIIRRRIDAYGLKEPRVQRTGEDRILVEIPGFDASEVARVRDIIMRTGRLEFRVVAHKDHPILEEAEKLKPKAPENWHWYTLRGQDEETGKPKEPEQLLISDEMELSGDNIERVRVAPGGATGAELAVHLRFVDRDKFWAVTRKYVKRRLAILLDDVRDKDGKLVRKGRLHSAPVIKEAILGDAEITGGFTQKTAEDLKFVLQSGSLKAPLKLQKEQYVGPYQGMKAIQDGRRAIVIGFVAVVVFILLYYLKAGLVADFALFLNLLILVAALALRNATLTLPGIAGIMLTIGMSIDANVLIFERIREELKKVTDKPLIKCMRDGHRKALVTIIDANLTTLLTAVILHEFGTGPIKGFAITLSYGIVISMFTAIVVTRILFEALVKINLVTSLPMLEFVKDPSIGFIRTRRVWLTFSALLVVAGLVYFFAGPGERLGIEFSSGTRVVVNLKEPTTAGVIRSDLLALGYDPDDIEVKAITEAGGGGGGLDHTAFSIRLRDLPDADVIRAGRSDPAKLPAFRGGAEVLVRLDRAVDLADMTDRLTEEGAAGCVLEQAEDPSTDEAFVYVVRNTDTAEDAVRDLESAVRAVFGSRLMEGNIRRALTDDAGAERLVPAGFRATQDGGVLRATVALQERVTPAALRDVLDAKLGGPGSVDVEGLDPGEDGRAARFNVVADTDPNKGPEDQVNQMKTALKDAEMATLEPFAKIDKIYPAVARELGTKAAVALGLALLAIVAYIWFRFEFRFGLAAVTALVHDVAITLGMLALFQYEINLTVIAALLTIIGYSLNDTIVVFDRVRENRRTVRKTAFPDIVNLSINQTLSRTLLTSLTTFIAVLSLFLFGGSAIENFAFTLLVGVVVGTYSSIFIASPVLLMIGEQGALRGPLSTPSGRTVRPLEGFRPT